MDTIAIIVSTKDGSRFRLIGRTTEERRGRPIGTSGHAFFRWTVERLGRDAGGGARWEDAPPSTVDVADVLAAVLVSGKAPEMREIGSGQRVPTWTISDAEAPNGVALTSRLTALLTGSEASA